MKSFIVTGRDTEMQEEPIMLKTMFDKIWDAHVVRDVPGESTVLYIDRHLVHEVTSSQAFAGLKATGRIVRRPDATLAVLDHNVPTVNGRRMLDVVDQQSSLCITTMEQNAHDFGITLFDMQDSNQGIVHVIGPELGITLPGMTLVCGDSHTSTHGALGVFAMGIGTSEVEHVLATQCLLQNKPKTINIQIEGVVGPGVTAKDVALAIIGKFGTGVGTGHVIEFSGSTVRGLSMEGRMTLCNMTIEAGARAGLVAPDETTFAYISGRPRAPKGAAYETAMRYWRTLRSDDDAVFDTDILLDAAAIPPMVTWGTSPEQALPITGTIPDPAAIADAAK